MLDVIFSRGLPLDRITTTDVWATDTISANLPPMEEFKARMDERIWHLYRVDVEHLCARNKDGSKKTYEQMFYHVPVRRSQTVQVERERERETGFARPRLDLRIPGSVEPVVSSWTQAEFQATECRERSPDSLRTPEQLLPKTQDCADSRASQPQSARGAGNSKSTRSERPPLRWAPHEVPEKKYRGIPGHRSGRTCPVWSAERVETGTFGGVRYR